MDSALFKLVCSPNILLVPWPAFRRSFTPSLTATILRKHPPTAAYRLRPAGVPSHNPMGVGGTTRGPSRRLNGSVGLAVIT